MSSSNFENTYNWNHEMQLQPQNLSMCANEPSTNEDHNSVPQECINLFPSSLPENPDEVLLKRSDLSSVYYQHKPFSIGTLEDHRHIDAISEELSSINVIPHSLNSGSNAPYGIYNIFNGTNFPQNAQETYIDDRLLALNGTDFDGNGEHVPNTISDIESQFYSPPSSTLFYANSLPPAESEENTYENASYNEDVQMTAVLDLSPTVSMINKAPQTDTLAPYILPNTESGKHLPRHVASSSYTTFISNGEGFKTLSPTLSYPVNSKYDSQTLPPPPVSVPFHEDVLHNQPLEHYNVDHSFVDLRQAKRLTRDHKDVFIHSVSRGFDTEDAGYANRSYVEHSDHKEASQDHLRTILGPSHQRTTPELSQDHLRTILAPSHQRTTTELSQDHLRTILAPSHQRITSEPSQDHLRTILGPSHQRITSEPSQDHLRTILGPSHQRITSEPSQDYLRTILGPSHQRTISEPSQDHLRTILGPSHQRTISEPSQDFCCDRTTTCSCTKPLKMVEEMSGTYLSRERPAESEFPHQDYQPNRYSGVETIPSIPEENSKSSLNYTDPRSSEEPKPDGGERPLKKSERLQKAKAVALIEKERVTKAVPKTPKPKKKQSVTCKVCSAEFSHYHSLKMHHYQHTGERPYQCKECGKRFTKSSNLSLHFLKHTGEKPHCCPTCRKCFRLSSTLKSHMLTHTGEKPFQCHICKLTFTQRAPLNRHVERIHGNVKTFKCTLCDNSFRDKFYFRKHLAYHELKAKHSCKVCGEGFNNSKKLQIHSMRHNEGPYPYKCNKCTAEFVSQKAWRQHKTRNHDKRRELWCEDCEAVFKMKESLKAHMRVHKGDNLIKCDFCQANFNNIGTLKKHQRKHQNNATKNTQPEDIHRDVSLSENSDSLSKFQAEVTSTRQLRTHRAYTKSDNLRIAQIDENSHIGSSPDSEHPQISDERTKIDIPREKYRTPTPEVNDLSSTRDTTVSDSNSDSTSNYKSEVSPVIPSRTSTSKAANHNNILNKCNSQSSAVSLLSAVLGVGDSNFERHEGRINFTFSNLCE